VNFMKKKLFFPALLLTCIFGVTGCGKDETLETYKEDMNAFYEAVQEKSDAIDMIDTSSETAVDELLGFLDDINQEFTALGEMTVPEQFASIEPLADDAASYMAEANRLYHEAYMDGFYDENTGEAAKQNYERAMKRISYIADIFRGEVPDDANVTVITEEEDAGMPENNAIEADPDAGE